MLDGRWRLGFFPAPWTASCCLSDAGTCDASHDRGLSTMLVKGCSSSLCRLLPCESGKVSTTHRSH